MPKFGEGVVGSWDQGMLEQVAESGTEIVRFIE